MTESLQDRLDAFRMEVQFNLTFGAYADRELAVVDDNGEHPVVIALDEERLAVVLRRVEAVGGYANLFVKGQGVRYVAVINSEGALDSESGVDMTGPRERPHEAATVGTFVDYLATQPAGVRLPISLPTRSEPAVARAPEVMEFTNVPA